MKNKGRNFTQVDMRFVYDTKTPVFILFTRVCVIELMNMNVQSHAVLHVCVVYKIVQAVTVNYHIAI